MTFPFHQRLNAADCVATTTGLTKKSQKLISLFRYNISRRSLYALVLLVITFTAQAQQAVGVKFEKGLSWKQIKEKAKKEKKYIFVDGYTTWCVPCKEMNKNIFPQQKVGDFLNKNFINVAVQFDVTKTDSKEVKSWYNDAKFLEKNYAVNVYPTYLFFNPDGDIVHYIIGGNKDADNFLKDVGKALNPKTQYVNLKEQYKKGKRDTAFLLSLIQAGQSSRDIDSIAPFINTYLKTQGNLLTKRNLGFISLGTKHSTDIGFNVLRKYPDQVDSVALYYKSRELVTDIIFDEVVLPLIRENGKKIEHGGGMVTYSGELIKNVDWDKVKEKLDLNYADLTEAVILKSRTSYYRSSDDWGNYCKYVSQSAAAQKLADYQLASYAHDILTFTNDVQYINQAVKWSEQATASVNKTNAWYLKTYSYLLYKSGQKELAIQQMEKFKKLADYTDEQADLDFVKMKAGEKI